MQAGGHWRPGEPSPGCPLDSADDDSVTLCAACGQDGRDEQDGLDLTMDGDGVASRD